MRTCNVRPERVAVPRDLHFQPRATLPAVSGEASVVSELRAVDAHGKERES
jgi:hypothetical protein